MSLATIGAGAGAGFLVGGPIGAVVGAVVGGVAGKKTVITLPPATPDAPPSAQASADLVNAVVDSPSPLELARTALQTQTSGPVAAPNGPRTIWGGPVTSPHPLPVRYLAGYGDIGPFPLWLIVTGLGVAAYAFMRGGK